MSDCLLVLYWPDFARLGVPASLVAHSLRRYLCTLHSDLHAYLYTGLGVPASDRSAFESRGFEVRPGIPTAEDLVGLRGRHPETDVVLAAEDRLAEQLAGASDGPQPQIWVPAPGSGAYPTLADVLSLGTAHSVGLLIDSATLAETTGDRLRTVERKLLRAAELVGSVVAAAGWEPGGRLVDLLQPGPGRAGASPGAILDSPEWQELHTWVLVTHGPWAGDAVHLAREYGIRVLLWAPDPQRVPALWAAQADTFAPCAEVLDLAPSTRLSFPVQAPSVQADVRIERHTVPRNGSAPAPDTLEDGRPTLSVQTLSESARLGPWVRLMYHLECIHRRNGWARGPLSRVAAELAEVEEFGPTPANAAMWVTRARVEGLLHVEHDDPRSVEAGRIPTCRPNPEHPVCRAAVEVPDRCLRLLFQMLQKIPWVSFKLLRSVLLREQWLGGPPYRLEEPTIDEWLNFLIHQGAIRMTKEPNLVNPDYPVTALRLNDEHPLSRAVVTDATESTRLAAERAILAVDHFLTRNRKPWMAMGALRRALDGMGRDELQAVLQGLQNLGALVTESYPNPQKEHFTTGCRLKTEEPIVARALEVRDRIIQATQRHGRDRSWVPLSRLSDSLAECAAGSSHQQLAWFLLLRDEGILELDQENVLPGQSWDDVRCRLNVSDAVVRAVIAQRDPGVPYAEYE